MEAFNTSHADQNLSRIDNLWENTWEHKTVSIYCDVWFTVFSAVLNFFSKLQQEG